MYDARFCSLRLNCARVGSETIGMPLVCGRNVSCMGVPLELSERSDGPYHELVTSCLHGSPSSTGEAWSVDDPWTGNGGERRIGAACQSKCSYLRSVSVADSPSCSSTNSEYVLGV